MNYINLSTLELTEQLQKIGLGIYSKSFIENNICGEILSMLTEKHLKDLGMKLIGHRITFLIYLKNF